MQVLIVNLDKKIFEPGSASLERLKEYAGFCEKLSVIVLTREKFEPIIYENLSVFATASSSKFRYTKDALKLADKIIKEENPNVIMTQDPYDTGHIGWLIKRKNKIPWQCQIHSDFLSPYFGGESLSNKIRVLASKFLLPKADGIRVVSERIKQSLKARSYKLKADPVVLPIFVDTEKFKMAPIRTDLKQKYSQFDFRILIASRLSQEKNIGLAVAAMAGIVKKYPKTGLIIVGEGEEKERLKNLVNKYNLQSSVIFEPWSDDLASYYKTADMFLLTSNYEGWGMSVVEAAACGCPIVMTDVGCAGELIKNEESGLVVKIENEDALVMAITRLIEDRDFGKKMAEKAKENISSLPTRQEYLRLYKKSWLSLIK